MKKIIIGSMIASSLLFGVNYNNLNNRIENGSKTIKINTIKVLTNDKSTEANRIISKGVLDKEYSVRQLSIKTLKKDKEKSSISLLHLLNKEIDNNTNRKYILIAIKKINRNLYREIVHKTNSEFKKFYNTNYKEKEVKKEVKKTVKIITKPKVVKPKSKPVIKSILKPVNYERQTIYIFKPKQSVDVNSIDISELTNRDKRILNHRWEEILNNKNIESNIKELSNLGSVIDEYLIEFLTVSNKLQRESSWKIIQLNHNEKEIIKQLISLSNFDDSYLFGLSNIKDIYKYQKIISNIYKKSNFETRKKLLKIAKKLKLKTVIKTDLNIQKEIKKKEIEKRRLERLEREKIRKLEKLEKRRLSQLKNERERIKKEEEEKIKKEQIKVDWSQYKKKKKTTVKLQPKFTPEELIIEGLKIETTMYKSIIMAGQKKLEDAIPLLEKILKGNKPLKFKKQVIFTLTKIGTSDCKRIIRDASVSKNRSISFIARRALKALTAKE